MNIEQTRVRFHSDWKTKILSDNNIHNEANYVSVNYKTNEQNSEHQH